MTEQVQVQEKRRVQTTIYLDEDIYFFLNEIKAQKRIKGEKDASLSDLINAFLRQAIKR